MTAELTLDDILDTRAYERVRDRYRKRVIEHKRSRRVPLGPIMTLVFESADTIRFQVQEMARVEHIVTDEGIQSELDVYNRLLPTPGELSATLFIELTSEPDLREWLPKLTGIERAIQFELNWSDPVVSEPEPSHEAALTRESVTPAVHYLRFSFTDAQVRALAGGGAALVSRHPAYDARAALSGSAISTLVAELEGTTSRVPID